MDFVLCFLCDIVNIFMCVCVCLEILEAGTLIIVTGKY